MAQSLAEDLSQQLSKWSRVISTRQHEIEKRLTQIEATERRLSDALASLSSSTAELVRQVNALLNESPS